MPRSMPQHLAPTARRRARPLALAWVLAAAWAGSWPAHAAPALQTFTVGVAQAGERYRTDATVEALRDARVASQVAGRIVALPVRAGERVQAGQVLARIEASVVAQQVAASQAQLAQAQAQAVVARNELKRSRQLFAKSYLSQAALDQAEAQARATEAQVMAMQAQVAAASAQAGLHVLRAPFAGWVAQVPVSVGDAAGPGQVLMQVYDPGALRVTALVPESVAPGLQALADVSWVRPDGGTEVIKALKAEVLPSVDPASRTVVVRVALPLGAEGFVPGQSVGLSLPWKAGDRTASPARLTVPRAAVVTRSELHGVYVVGQGGSARLRQVRLGRSLGDAVEVLAGLASGERVALDPVLAAGQSAPTDR